MTVSSRLIAASDIDRTCPINWDDPLSACLFAAWHGVPYAGRQVETSITGTQSVLGTEGVNGRRIFASPGGQRPPASIGTQYGRRYQTNFGGVASPIGGFTDDDSGVFSSSRDRDTCIISMACVFTCEQVTNFCGLICHRATSAFPFLMTSSAAGNPLTAMWTASVGEYGASTGLAIPTDGSLCMGAMSPITGVGLRIWLATESGINEYTVSETITPKTIDQRWYIGHDPLNTYWRGTVGPFWIWKNRILTRDDIDRLWTDPYATFRARRGVRSVSVAPAATPWLYTQRSVKSIGA